VNDTVEVREVHHPNDGRDPFPVLISRQKIPKNRYDVDSTFPAVVLELSDKEIKEYLSPADFDIGKSVQLYNRRFFLYDCDNFTKAYYWKNFGRTDFTPIAVDRKGNIISQSVSSIFQGTFVIAQRYYFINNLMLNSFMKLNFM
jgi:EF-hand domain-containing protein 1